MHKAICDSCKRECEVPFKPTSGKPIYCNNCFQDKGGNKRNDRREYRRDSGNRQRHSAICDGCGKPCELPFKPTSGKPVFCDNCFKGKRGSDNRGRGRSRDRDKGRDRNNESNKQLDQINEKLNKILEMISKPEAKKEVKTEKAKKEVEKKTPAKKATTKKTTKTKKKPTTKKNTAKKKTTKKPAKKK